MVREADLRRLIEAAYRAGTDASKWPEFLGELGHALDASFGVFLVQDVKNQTGSYTAGWPLAGTAQLLRSYSDYYCTRNVWTIFGAESLVPGAITPTEATCPESELVKSEFYNDFLRPAGVRHGIAATILREGSLTANVSVVRGARPGAFGADEARLMRALTPHLQRAIATHRRLEGMRLEEHAALDALDRLSVGVLLVDREARPFFVNAEARRVLTARDGLSVDRGVLSAVRPGDTQRLRALVHGAASPHAGGGHLALGRPSLQRPLGIEVTSLSIPGGDPVTHRVAAVFVADPDREVGAPEALIARLYGLTLAEAGIATRLAAGETLDEVAAARGITRGTARIHLKRALRKTGWRGQSELVRRLLSGPATLTRHLAAGEGHP